MIDQVLYQMQSDVDIIEGEKAVEEGYEDGTYEIYTGVMVGMGDEDGAYGT